MRILLHTSIDDVRELNQSQLEDINKSLKSEPPISKSKYLLQFINNWINNADKKSVILLLGIKYVLLEL
jgi:hypothetical protein